MAESKKNGGFLNPIRLSLAPCSGMNKVKKKYLEFGIVFGLHSAVKSTMSRTIPAATCNFDQHIISSFHHSSSFFTFSLQPSKISLKGRIKISPKEKRN